MEEARFVGIRGCPRCHETLALLLPGRAPTGPDGEAIALGVRVERAVAAFLEEDNGVRAFVVACHGSCSVFSTSGASAGRFRSASFLTGSGPAC